MNVDHQHWIKRIWNKPIDTTQRLAFADWLEEHDMSKAAKKQREIVKIIEQSYLIFSCKLNLNALGPRVYGFIERKTYSQCFQLRPDGGFGFVDYYETFDPYVKDILKGNKKQIDRLYRWKWRKKQKPLPSYQREKSRAFSEVYGSLVRSVTFPEPIAITEGNQLQIITTVNHDGMNLEANLIKGEKDVPIRSD